tara:strand:+ start:4536 stop:5213 length:678 start_codon:yes stop_codon:yes gene_type:complete
MKNKEDICLVVQARLGSERLPGKMLKPFAESNLVDILFKKLKKLKNIPQSNIFFSAYEQELKDVAIENRINIYERSEESANSEGQPLSEIYEWYNVLPFKYVVLVSACNPLLKISTIDDFIKSFINSEKEGGFAVFEKKTYYWDKNFKPITDWKDSTIMNTKYVDPIYEAAHCLYASKMDFIADDFWMDNKSPAEPELFVMDEIEAFDIDHEWQFNTAKLLYANL